MTVIVKNIFFTVVNFIVDEFEREFHKDPFWAVGKAGAIGLGGIALLGSLFTSRSSDLDASKHFSARTWAVTLTAAKGYGGIHAQIVVEGKEWGLFSFIKIADFCADCCGCCGCESEVKFHKPKDGIIGYSRKSEVWLVSSSKVKRMLKVIKQEEKGRIEVPKMSMLGSDALFSGKGTENCTTWARKKIEILDINLGKSKIGWLFTTARTFTS